MILILEIINNTTVHLINETSNIVHGAFIVGGAVFTGVAVAAGATLLKTGIAALGIEKRKERQRQNKK